MPTKKSPAKTKQPLQRLGSIFPWMLIIGGVIGLICSFIISYDKIRLLENPHFQPSCDLNPVISCGSVMSSKQGSVFGFPNPWIGLAAFAVLVTIGVAILAGAKFKAWFWRGLLAGTTLGFIFAYWLLFESVYRIKALCPYCLTVDVIVTTLMLYTTLHVYQQGFLTVPKRLKGVGRFVKRHHLDALIAWFIIVIAVVLKHFWYYYGQHL